MSKIPVISHISGHLQTGTDIQMHREKQSMSSDPDRGKHNYYRVVFSGCKLVLENIGISASGFP